MLINGPIFSYEPATISALYENVLTRDFELLQRIGMRGAVAYGDALRDADNESPTHQFNYYGQLPLASSSLTALSLVTRGLLRELKGTALQSLKATQNDNAMRFTFTLEGRKLDITMLNNCAPGAELAARAAPIGLSGIAVNDRGFCFASEAYLDDKSLKTMTIKRDMDPSDRHYARKQAGCLLALPAYKGFKICG